MKYPYQGRNLFHEPEKYFFADCASPDFLDAWKTSRQEAMEQLDIANYPVPEDHPEFSAPAEYTKTGQVFADFMESDDPSMLVEEIDIFVVKYEVNKRLYAEYDTSKRPLKNAGLAALPDYLAFGECLAQVSLENDSLKHLSTLLKLCDALCSAPVAFPLSLRLIALLQTEERLVDRV